MERLLHRIAAPEAKDASTSRLPLTMKPLYEAASWSILAASLVLSLPLTRPVRST